MKRNSNFFMVVAAIIALGGVIFGIVLGATNKYYYDDIPALEGLRFNVGLMIQTWIIADIIALAFHWMAMVLRKFENIEKAFGADNNGETLLSGIKELTSSIKKSSSSHNSVNAPNTHIYANGWICPKCGRFNQSYVGSCGCGQNKPEK